MSEIENFHMFWQGTASTVQFTAAIDSGLSHRGHGPCTEKSLATGSIVSPPSTNPTSAPGRWLSMIPGDRGRGSRLLTAYPVWLPTHEAQAEHFHFRMLPP